MARNFICLVIDDDDDDGMFFQAAFTQLGTTSHCWLSPGCQQAIQRVDLGQEPVPDYIFLDLQLGAATVKESLDLLKSHQSISTAQIIILSGADPAYQADWLNSRGIFKIIQKQASIGLLADQIKQVLSLS
ncbi:response regulator [Dyadobacter sediminis]|uniref:Response regulator n=1 Tax=Dyadobacter sediminis TaxID=1493691 RepID=A0A5R9K4K9_9BACT|nr:response regulator [Dyadobacter sediminis]TLU88725.1 response regulator [Dyadobacter sediminis]